MHGKDLKEDVINSKAKDASGDFGVTNTNNFNLANSVNAANSNQKAAPSVGESYAIVQSTPIKDDCYYHAAAVVAIDGSDHITLEVFGHTGAGARNEAGQYHIYNSDPTKGLSFHDKWSKTFTSNAITIAITKK